MQFDSKRFNVLVRGKHTLFVVTQKKPDGSMRDPELLRKQLANMLFTDLRSIVPNHDYDGLPEEGQWFCFRFKGSIPRTIRRPSIETGNHEFIAKEAVLNFVDETKPVHKTSTVFRTMPGTEDEPMREEMAAPTPNIAANDAMLILLTEVLKNQQYLAEIIGKMAMKL